MINLPIYNVLLLESLKPEHFLHASNPFLNLDDMMMLFFDLIVPMSLRLFKHSEACIQLLDLIFESTNIFLLLLLGLR